MRGDHEQNPVWLASFLLGSGPSALHYGPVIIVR
jgi:hypothetical protein